MGDLTTMVKESAELHGADISPAMQARIDRLLSYVCHRRCERHTLHIAQVLEGNQRRGAAFEVTKQGGEIGQEQRRCREGHRFHPKTVLVYSKLHGTSDLVLTIDFSSGDMMHRSTGGEYLGDRVRSGRTSYCFLIRCQSWTN